MDWDKDREMEMEMNVWKGVYAGRMCGRHQGERQLLSLPLPLSLSSLIHFLSSSFHFPPSPPLPSLHQSTRMHAQTHASIIPPARPNAHGALVPERTHFEMDAKTYTPTPHTTTTRHDPSAPFPPSPPFPKKPNNNNNNDSKQTVKKDKPPTPNTPTPRPRAARGIPSRARYRCTS